MKTISLKLCLAFSAFLASESLFAQTKPLYQLPENLPEKKITFKEKDKDGTPFLLGTDSGLFKILSNGTAEPLWTEGKVDRILKTAPDGFLLLIRELFPRRTLRRLRKETTDFHSLL